MEPGSYSRQSEHADLVHDDAWSALWVPQTSPHPWDGYLNGPENELAMGAAQAMARSEHTGISPLVVYGPSGVGKSRLLAGLVAERLHRQPDSRVEYLDAQAFIAECVQAAATAGRTGWASLHGRFRTVDLFVLEDLEGLERGPMAHEELIHTLDALEAAGAAVAFSARTAPGTWPTRIWPRRLIARLGGGLVISITPPGLTSRRRYVLHRAALQGVVLQADAVETLAQAADGYRTLEGWISRLALEGRLRHKQEGPGQTGKSPPSSPGPHGFARSRPNPIDPPTIAAILADETGLAEALVSIDVITDVVAAEFDFRPSILRGPTRRAAIVRVRHLAMYLARKFTRLSFAAIGAYFGGRDAATVRHACMTTSQRLNVDPILAAVVARLEARWLRLNA